MTDLPVGNTATVMPGRGPARAGHDVQSSVNLRTADVAIKLRTQFQQRDVSFLARAAFSSPRRLPAPYTDHRVAGRAGAPTRLVYGMEIVGRNWSDLHAVISQFSNAPAQEYVRQALTTDAWLGDCRERLSGRCAELVVLWTFPLAALRRSRSLVTFIDRRSRRSWRHWSSASRRASRAGGLPSLHRSDSVDSALPLALIALVERPTIWRVAAFAAASGGLLLANFEAALIAAL